MTQAGCGGAYRDAYLQVDPKSGHIPQPVTAGSARSICKKLQDSNASPAPCSLIVFGIQQVLRRSKSVGPAGPPTGAAFGRGAIGCVAMAELRCADSALRPLRRFAVFARFAMGGFGEDLEPAFAFEPRL